MEPAIIELRDVVKRFGAVTAVDGVSLAIPRGVCYALLGPNGAGKTTISRMIGGVLPRDGGSIDVLGLDPWRQQSEVKARLGVVMQHDALDEELDVEQNLRIYGLFFWKRGPAFRKKLAELLEFVALRGRAKMPIHALSGGMKRRLVIARALLSDPEILVLDEPTTGLDPQIRQTIWSMVRDLKKKGMTILLTTHYMEEASQLADRVGIVDRGHLIAENDADSFIERVLPAFVLEFEEHAGDGRHLGTWKVVERHGDRVYVFDDDEQRLREWLSEQDLNEARLRPTSLEDVFLKLTGRGLHE